AASRSSATYSVAARRWRSTACSRPASAWRRWTPSRAGASGRWWPCAAPTSWRSRSRTPCGSRSCSILSCMRRRSCSSVRSEMRAMVFDRVGEPLRMEERPIPQPGPGQLLIKVHACAVCRTDLHLLDGEVEVPHPPRILGHMIVGTVEPGGSEDAGGRRVGVPWLGWTDGECEYCRSGRENLCPNARFTGRDIDGGYAEYTVADERYCFPIPESYTDEQAAPLLCAGLIGYRALRMCGEAQRLGFYGFGDSAHILAQICRWQGREVYAFTRAGDQRTRDFARELGAVWAGSSEEQPPEPLQAAIIFAPVGPLVPLALRALAPGGTVVCAGIHM